MAVQAFKTKSVFVVKRGYTNFHIFLLNKECMRVLMQPVSTGTLLSNYTKNSVDDFRCFKEAENEIQLYTFPFSSDV
jgi:hypothetical protein